MGSMTEEEIFQCFLASDELRPTSCISPPPSDVPSPKDRPRHLNLLQEILGRTTDAEVEVHEKILMYVRDVGFGWKPPDLEKLLVITLGKDGYEASLCKTSWVSTFAPSKCCVKVLEFTGHHEYIDVMVGDENGEKQTRLIVDVGFRSQFEVARPTPTYQELTNAIPLIFVGTEEKLKKIISLLCSAAKRSMRERDLHIPPWRKADYMHSKWFSKDCKKISVSDNMDLVVVE